MTVWGHHVLHLQGISGKSVSDAAQSIETACVSAETVQFGTAKYQRDISGGTARYQRRKQRRHSGNNSDMKAIISDIYATFTRCPYTGRVGTVE
jgi:hypothetical protein